MFCLGQTILLLLAVSAISAEPRRRRLKEDLICEAQGKLNSEVKELRREVMLLQEEQQTLNEEMKLLREEIRRSQDYIHATFPEDCSDAKRRGIQRTGPVMVAPPGLDPKMVRCERDDWTVILRRENCGFRENFNRTWEEYARGFGDVNLEYWIGNEVLHSLTKSRPYQFMVEMEDHEGVRTWGRWNHFKVHSREDHYRLEIRDKEEGNATDAMSYHNDRTFTTYDNMLNNTLNCAMEYGGGWWFHRCFRAFPTGVGLHPGTYHEHAFHWDFYEKTHLALKSLLIMIRPGPDVC
ncbi:ficolin-1-like [Oratosquilla oratoria]|uniref:ficolin-1-like n=1 Tax=Oratosquilla oratoria TaxID=337810 RepID=UPI003F77134F